VPSLLLVEAGSDEIDPVLSVAKTKEIRDYPYEEISLNPDIS
jgi:hypothetical protein